MVEECDICGATFKTVTNLNQHKRTAKYCIRKAEALTCTHCKQVSTDSNHLEECLNYKIYKLEIELTEIKIKFEHEREKCIDLELKLEKELKFKDDLLVKNAARPTNKNVNYNLSVIVFPPEDEVKRQWEDMISPEFLKGGIKVFARAGHDHFLMKDGIPKVVCVDPARDKFMYMNSDNIYKYDMKLQNITKKLFSPGADVALKLIKKFAVENDEDEELFTQAIPISYIANINSSSHKEFIRHLQYNIQVASERLNTTR